MYTTPARTREKGRARARTEETECQRRAGRPDQRARRRIRWKEEGREGGRLSERPRTGRVWPSVSERSCSGTEVSSSASVVDRVDADPDYASYRLEMTVKRAEKILQ